MVDVQGLGNALASDFAFAVWDGFSATGFVRRSPSRPFTVYPIGQQWLLAGQDRIRGRRDREHVAPHYGQWGNDRTDLPENDVFYFGNAIGDMYAGNPTVVRVNATDTAIVRQNQSTGTNSVAIARIHDVNKDVGSMRPTPASCVRTSGARSSDSSLPRSTPADAPLRGLARPRCAGHRRIL